MGLFFTPLPFSFYVCLVGEKRCREISIIFGYQHNLQSCEYFVVVWISLLVKRQPICRVLSGIPLGKAGTLLLFSSDGSNIVTDGCSPSSTFSNVVC